MYVHGGYRVLSTLDVHARFDAWDPDVERESDAASSTERDYMTGFSWTLSGSPVKVQTDLTRRTWSASLSPSRWQLLMNLQTTW